METKTNEELRIAWDFVEHTGRSIFLTGKAGTGKTTFLKTVVEQSKKRTIVVAPTGVAAINAGGMTIHSFFQLPFTPYVPNARIQSKFDFGKEKRHRLCATEVSRSLQTLRRGTAINDWRLAATDACGNTRG